MIFIIKVTTNKEERALDLIGDRVEKKKLAVYSMFKAHGVKGYLFLEADTRSSAEESIFNLPYIKGIIGKTINYEEIKGMVETNIAAISIKVDDIVELLSEPFKREKARVVRVDKGKGEVVVNLLGAVVPLPVTIKIDNVRVIRREEE